MKQKDVAFEALNGKKTIVSRDLYFIEANLHDPQTISFETPNLLHRPYSITPLFDEHMSYSLLQLK
jgi:hypothetical protein